MVNYVNQDNFIQWYNSVSKVKATNTANLLEKVHQHYCNTGSSIYTVPASKTISGKDEHYSFRYEDIGCCGASTRYIYF